MWPRAGAAGDELPAMRASLGERAQSQRAHLAVAEAAAARTWSLPNTMATPPRVECAVDNGDDDGDGEEAYVLDESLHAMNYFVLVVFHEDVDHRACCPVLQVVHLAQTMPLVSKAEDHAGQGSEILRNCQLGGTANRSASALRVNALGVLAVYALSLTDLEANMMINNVHDVNQLLATQHVNVTNRTNMAFMPRFLHKSMAVGTRSIDHLRTATDVTDVQLAVLLLRESLSAARSITVQLARLHPFLATPSNMHEAIQTFTRRVSIPSFLRGRFRFTES